MWANSKQQAILPIKENMTETSHTTVLTLRGASVLFRFLERLPRLLHLARTRHDVYYRVVGTPRRLEILALWQSSGGSRPAI